MADVTNDFFEDDEAAEKIHALFDGALETALTKRPVPCGGVFLTAEAWTVGAGGPAIIPGVALTMTIESGVPTSA